MSAGWHVLVMAKTPAPGRVKTRLCPPLSPVEAASLAEAALADTLDAVAGCGADRRVLALEGEPGGWLPPGFTVIPQRLDRFADRLAAAWSDVGGPGVQIGMDTPQVTAELLNACLAVTADGSVTATIGPAVDGGWWALGLAEGWDVDVFSGVPMSTPRTGALQRARLLEIGHRVGDLPILRDVDHIADARGVADQVPGSRFARRLAGIDRFWPVTAR